VGARQIRTNHRESNPGLLRAAILYAVTAVRRQETISPELDLGAKITAQGIATAH